MPKNLRDWLSWLIKLRIVVVTTLLGVTLGIESVGVLSDASAGLFLIIGAAYLASGVHFMLLRGSKAYRSQAYLQIATDQVMIFLIIYVTGGIDSYFSFLYLLSIIMSSILLYRRGAFLTATGSSLLTVLQVLVLQLGWLPPTHFSPVDPRTVKFLVGTNLFAFYAVAYLSSYLSESLRRAGSELEDKRGKLANLQAFNENIINSMRGGLFTTNLDGFITLFNRSASEITGHKPERVIGSHISRVFNLSDAQDQPNETGPLPARFEKTIRHVNGEEIHLGFTVSRLQVEANQHIGYVYTFQDLTEIRKLEKEIQLKDRMAAIGRMAAAIAHEIRNPLTAISGSFHLLKSDLELNADQEQLANNILLETKRLYKIITDFLSYAKPLRFSPQSVKLPELISDTVQLLRNSPEVSAEHIILCRFESDDLMCFGDPNLLKQALWNLCGNALRAMPSGGKLSVRLAARVAEQLELSVSDTGVGLTPEERERIFEPFQSKFHGGTGLGLSVVSQIVELHQGTIDVISEPGKGTTFVLTLPRVNRSMQEEEHVQTAHR
ncbi:MAG: ATP-binding protein [Acidobacteriota bacterium]